MHQEEKTYFEHHTSGGAFRITGSGQDEDGYDRTHYRKYTGYPDGKGRSDPMSGQCLQLQVRMKMDPATGKLNDLSMHYQQALTAVLWQKGYGIVQDATVKESQPKSGYTLVEDYTVVPLPLYGNSDKSIVARQWEIAQDVHDALDFIDNCEKEAEKSFDARYAIRALNESRYDRIGNRSFIKLRKSLRDLAGQFNIADEEEMPMADKLIDAIMFSQYTPMAEPWVPRKSSHDLAKIVFENTKGCTLTDKDGEPAVGKFVAGVKRIAEEHSPTAIVAQLSLRR